MPFQMPHRHFFFESAPLMHELMAPLRKKGVTSLVYVDARLDGSEIRLSNQANWLAHYYQSQLYLKSGFEKKPDSYLSGIAVWSYLSHHQPILQAALDFQIAHGFTLIERKKEGCEFYFIGTHPNQAFLGNHLLNQLEQIKQDILDFKERGKSLIREANQHAISIPRKYEQNQSQEQGILIDSRSATRKHTHLWTLCTQREIQCATLWKRGLTANEIGQTLHLSRRTVENHLQQIKNKLGVKTKFELIQLLHRYHI